MKQILFFCLVGMAVLNGHAALQKPQKSPQPHSVAQPMDLVNMPSIGALFLQNSTFATTISIVNAGNASVTGRLVLQALDGMLISDTPVPVAGHSSTSLQIADILLSVGSKMQQGRVELYDDSVEGSALAGQLTLTYQDRARTHVLDEELAMPSMTTSHALHATAVDSTDSPYIAVTNPRMQPEDVTENCYPEGAPATQLHFTIRPQQTQLLHGCQVLTSTFDIDSIQPSSLASTTAMAYAIELVTSSPQDEIQAFGIAPSSVSGTHAWTSVNFFDPATAASDTTIFAGIPIGLTPLMWGTYTPHLALHNFAKQPQTISLRLDSTISGFVTSNTLQTLHLQPDESRTVLLSGVSASKELLNTLIVQGSDPAGGIAAQLILQDSSQDIRTQLIGKSGADDTNMGMHPWHVSDVEDSDLLLYNQTSVAQKAKLKIGNGESIWEKTVVLAPFATHRVSIQSLLAAKAVDDSGKALSKGKGLANPPGRPVHPAGLRGVFFGLTVPHRRRRVFSVRPIRCCATVRSTVPRR